MDSESKAINGRSFTNITECLWFDRTFVYFSLDTPFPLLSFYAHNTYTYVCISLTDHSVVLEHLGQETRDKLTSRTYIR